MDWIREELKAEKSKEHLLYEAQKIASLIKPELVEMGHFSVNRMQRIVDIYRNLNMAPSSGNLNGLYYQHHFSNSNL